MSASHTDIRLFRSIVIAILMFHIMIAEAGDTINILQPTRDLMPLVGTRTMMQDSEGYVWYGTVEGGLCRDNGYQIDMFRNDRHNPRRIGQSNGILSMCEDAGGNIIFGTRKNIFVLDKQDYSIRQLNKNIPDGRVAVVSCGANGIITAETSNGSYTFDRNYRLIGKTGPDRAGWCSLSLRAASRTGTATNGQAA